VSLLHNTRALRLLEGNGPSNPGGLPDPRRLRQLGRTLPNWARELIGRMIAEYDGQLAQARDALEDYAETRDRLRITQHVLIRLLERQGGSITLSAGEINSVPVGSVVGVTKLGAGEGDGVDLLIYWRPPGGKPAQVDLEPLK
jgi:hypothetical protein